MGSRGLYLEGLGVKDRKVVIGFVVGSLWVA